MGMLKYLYHGEADLGIKILTKLIVFYKYWTDLLKIVMCPKTASSIELKPVTTLN